jgi:16S rRNA (uracil1498-N3)-methyltransferase
MRRFAVPGLAPVGATLALDGDAAHHLLTVIRLHRGERVMLFDGGGREAMAELTEVAGRTPILTVLEAPRDVRPAFPLHLLLAVAKGPAMDDAIRMATEAGATDLRPVLTARSVSRGDRADRWERIAASASQQSGRADYPTVHPVRPLADAIAALPDGLDRRVGAPGAARLPPAMGAAAVLIGPEGGLTRAELDAALAAAFRPMGLGAFVFRVETAAAVAVAMTAGLSDAG